MNLKKSIGTLAGVEVFLTVGTLVAALCSSPAVAQEAPKIEINGKVCETGQFYDIKSGTCKTDLAGTCKDLLGEATEARDKANSDCAAAGLNGGKCKDQIARCVGAASQAAGTSNGLDLNPILSSLAPTLGLPPMSLPGQTRPGVAGCPTQNSRDYFDSKERIDRDIKQTQDDMAELSTEIADEKEKMDKMMAESQKELADAQKQLRENERALDQSKREQIGEQQKQQAEAANGLRSASKAMLAKRQEIAKYDEQYAMELGQYTEELAKLTCMDQIQKKRAELNSLIPASSGGGGFLQAGNERRKALEAMWATCISTVRQQRIAKINERKRYMEASLRELESMQAQVDEGHQALSTYNQQMTESLQAVEKQKTEGQQELFQQMQLAQQSLVAAQQTTQQRQQALMSKQQTAQMRLATLQQDLANLGPVPERGVTKPWREAQSSYLNFLGKADAYIVQCCGSGEGKSNKNELCKVDSKAERRSIEAGSK